MGIDWSDPSVRGIGTAELNLATRHLRSTEINQAKYDRLTGKL